MKTEFYDRLIQKYSNQEWWKKCGQAQNPSVTCEQIFSDMVEATLEADLSFTEKWIEALQWNPELQEKVKAIVVRMTPE